MIVTEQLELWVRQFLGLRPLPSHCWTKVILSSWSSTEKLSLFLFFIIAPVPCYGNNLIGDVL